MPTQGETNGKKKCTSLLLPPAFHPPSGILLSEPNTKQPAKEKSSFLSVTPRIDHVRSNRNKLNTHVQSLFIGAFSVLLHNTAVYTKTQFPSLLPIGVLLISV